MFFFIVSSLVLCFLVQSDSPWLPLLEATPVLYFGIGLCVAALVAATLNKHRLVLFHDVFATASLLIWFSYWRELFKEASPFFFLFPLYFVFIGALLELALLSQQSLPDRVTLDHMRSFVGKSRLQLGLIMVVVLVSLGLEEHYLLYPTAVTVLLIRAALGRYLKSAAEQ